MSLKNLIASAAAVIAMTLASQASATVYQFTYSAPIVAGGGTDTASGLLFVTPASGDSFLVTGISGLYNGSAITGLLATGTCCASPFNDNLIFPNNDAPPGTGLLDLGGIGFTTATENVNLYFALGFTGYSDITGPLNQSNPIFSDFGTFTLQAPEPLTLSVFGAGLAGAVAMRRRKKKTA